MKQEVLGNYRIGLEMVQVALREGDGGEFYYFPEDGSTPRIVIGADNEFEDVLGVLIHEVGELSMCRLGLRYMGSEDMSNDHSGYLFVLTHPQFSDVCNRLAYAIATVQKDLKKAWKKWHKAEKVVAETESVQ
jgi:hypothetical protein